MMKARVMLSAAALAVASFGVLAAEPPVSAANAMAIARSNACMGYHAIDRELVGPSFQQVTEKYKGDAQAPTKLAAKVKNGGSGVWGSIPMPSHPSMNDTDIKTVVAWVLAGAPQK
ncbi:Cytochrome c551/c552 [Candidatus Burkholderia brachyanthoides]|nr:Cytochrome c551/c552 [Candidatus Burkholderia brachyanthoides]